MKALVIAPQPFFSPRGTPFSVYYRTLVTTELGVKIDLLTYGEGDDVDIPGLRIIRIPRFSFLGNIKIGPSLLKMFLDIFMVVWTIFLLAFRRYDFVHAHEESIFFCRFLKPIFRFRLVYDMHSSLPQQVTNFKFTKSKLLIGLFEKLEDTCLKSSDAVITICPDLAEYAMKLIDDTKKHFLIENSIFETVRLSNKPSKHSDPSAKGSSGKLLIDLPEDKSLIVYAGTLEHYQGIDILINAFQNVIKESQDAFLLVVGGTDSQVEHYSSMAEEKGLHHNSLFTGRVDQGKAKYYNSLASVIVSPRSAGTNTPLKIYELLASGIPIVATNIYSHTQILNDSVAFLTAPEPVDMARGILNALNDEDERKSRIESAKKLYEEKYSREIYTGKMKSLLRSLQNG